MKTTYKISLFLLALCVTSVTFWACNRTVKKDEVLGNTELKSAPADFTGIIGSLEPRVGVDKVPAEAWKDIILTNSNHPVRFGPFPTPPISSPDYIYFTNNFSHEVTWFVTFTGRTTGAHRQYSGTSQSLDINTFRFDGSSDGRFFLFGEYVDYTISFLGSSITYTGDFFIRNTSGSGNINYDGLKRTLPNGDILRYRVIDDMEGNQPGVKTSYSDAADGAGKAVFFVTDQIQRSGYFSYYMKGTDNNGNGYSGGSSGEALTELQNYTTLTDPSKIYFNAYIYGYGRPNTAVFMQAFENDFATPPTFPGRVTSQNDMYYTIIEVNWVGWKLVSVPYTSFKPANNPASGGGGNRIKEPHKLCGFGIELDAYPTTGVTIEAAIDDIIMSENGPFQP